MKGTARMMGFTAIADAGKLLEETWKGVHDGEVAMSPTLAGALAQLAAGLEAAVDADPRHGPPALAEALRTARLAVGGKEPPRPRPRPWPGRVARWRTPTSVACSGPSTPGPSARTSGVNAASLFRLINEVCSLRVDAGALADLVDEVTAALGDGEATTSWAGPALRLGGRRREDSGGSGEPRLGPGLQSAAAISPTPTPSWCADLARKAGKEIRFELVGDHHAVDRLVLDGLSDPLRQLLVNAVEHGVEPTVERVAAGKPPTATMSLRATGRSAAGSAWW